MGLKVISQTCRLVLMETAKANLTNYAAPVVMSPTNDTSSASHDGTVAEDSVYWFTLIASCAVFVFVVAIFVHKTNRAPLLASVPEKTDTLVFYTLFYRFGFDLTNVCEQDGTHTTLQPPAILERLSSFH